MPKILGAHPFARDDRGRLRSRIATLFPSGNMLVTLPGIHATQRLAYVEALNQQRVEQGEAPLSLDEQMGIWQNSVDLIVDQDAILIRPDPDNMPLAFWADEMLQELVPKHKIKFLYALNDKVRLAIKKRGECWRISPLPKSWPEVVQMIEAAKIGIAGEEIYYYSRQTGSRILTYAEFARLAALDDDGLRRHLEEIRQYAQRRNSRGNPEIVFFAAARDFSAARFEACDFHRQDGTALRAAHEQLREQFAAAVAADFRVDNPEHAEWRNRMYAVMIGRDEESVGEEELQGLSSEFFMQIHWLPGVRIEEGEMLFDPIFDLQVVGDDVRAALCDEKCRGIIINYVREYGDLEWINVGCVIGSLSRRQHFFGRRDVYIAVVKLRSCDTELVHIIRMQKWGVREHLDEGRTLEQAMLLSEDYTEYIFDRRMGCRQLGMNLCPHVSAHKLNEIYAGKRDDCRGQEIRSPYFQRDYIRGIATDKIPAHRFQSEQYALAFAHLLGRAAAPNMIVGRFGLDGNVLFDDGDEVVLENDEGLPVAIIVADLTGTFANYFGDLSEMAAAYAAPLVRRLRDVPHPDEFLAAYLDAFEGRFRAIRDEFLRQQAIFENLFEFRRRKEPGSFPYRWRRVLQRLLDTDPHTITECIREKVTADCPV